MIYPYAEDPSRALDAAVRALEGDGLVVLPTDTVYGIGANAFSPAAVERLLAAKGRGRQMPPPVLVARPEVASALAADLPDGVRALMEAFWPGALTVIVRAQPALAWDLGETAGTVALRMPDHPVALAVLERYGPMAVTSANLTGEPAAEDAASAAAYFGAGVPVYLDAGPTPGPVPSTIVDTTTDPMRIVRAGAIGTEAILAIIPTMQAPAP